MNDYVQGAVGKCIHATDGTVVKYIGDAIFAFWNAPDPQNDHAVRACEAALKFREQSRLPVAGKKLVTRIGLHTGVANVGNFGSETGVDYTAIGENINLALRMEGLNKHLGTDVLITGDVKKEIGAASSRAISASFSSRVSRKAWTCMNSSRSGKRAARPRGTASLTTRCA